jgi:hypothetical protein
MEEVVWLHEYRRFGFLLHRGAWASTVRFQNLDGSWTEETVENDDYDLWEERAIEYDDDGD